MKICNDSPPYQSKIRRLLAEYVKPCTREEECYAPFVNTFNHALKEMKECSLPLLREINKKEDLDIMFHRNDPKDLTGIHGGLKTLGCPDVVLVAHGSAFRAAGDSARVPSMPWDDLAFKVALEKPYESFRWADCLSCQEFKRHKDPSGTLPHEYTDTFTLSITPLSNLDQEHPNEDGVWRKDFAAVRPSSSSSQHLNTPRKSITKCKSPDQSGGSMSKKPKVEGEKELPPIVQCGIYGAEMLMRGPYAAHAINLLIIDNCVWVWWYDRQGAIQSSGVNFVTDLPYFLVLLAVFQRFTLKDWGIETSLMNEAEKHHRRIISSAGKYLAEEHPHHDRQSLYMTAIACLAEIYWPEIERRSEVDILKVIEAKSEGDDLVRGHIPFLVDSQDLAYSTGTIRDEISLLGELRREGGNVVSSPRLLRVILLRKLEPIENLKGVLFVRAWIDCYRCHFRLWLHGVEHGDISLYNLMYNPDTKRGVLNDFDLTVIREGSEERKPTGKECTGTVPFMALDLLMPDYYSGKITRLYRHDLESFVWVLPFVLLRNYSTDQDTQLNTWCTRALRACEAVWKGIGLGGFNWLIKLTMHKKEDTELWYGSSEDSARKMLKMFEEKITTSLGTHPVAEFHFDPLSEVQLRL
ncbi:hypothetical protein SCP_0505860 [Sparassis crispa]|uniref:Fungal-type protein kinase domain-containing protein n=1 Tax=Sparassis crispa TaxID=139825 RepID=A0A401GMW2_9APHY|nr:hypothetical protein SCP_0505860 [Sparassis crispa]GBE83532.1 hypothetical protein SCP_0505860 [Sparassis crispa]